MDFIVDETRIYAQNPEGEILALITFPKTTEQTVEINHTFVHDSLRGQGVASKLMKLAIDEIRKRHLKIVPTCSYAVVWFEKHPEAHESLA